MVTFIRALWRILFFAIGSLFYICRIWLLAVWKGENIDRNLRLRREWFHIICKVLGVRLEVFGTMPKEAGLLVFNHRSYFDPIIVMTRLLAFPVGKIEMQKWPIIGSGAKISGVVFVDRKNKEGRSRARKEILEKLQQGYFVINYPEGTTHTQSQTLAFKPGVFRDAALTGFRIYPAALEYQNDRDAFVGEDTFLPHFFKCFGKKNTHIRIHYGTALQSDDAEFLRLSSQKWIDESLLALRKDWHSSSPKVD